MRLMDWGLQARLVALRASGLKNDALADTNDPPLSISTCMMDMMDASRCFQIVPFTE
jgi:hypothetical protein